VERRLHRGDRGGGLTLEPAFRNLEHALLRRRWRALEPVLRLELAAIAFLLAGFLFLQLRGPFEALVARSGAPALAGVLALVALVLAGGAAWMVAARHARRLRRPEGPEWFALPIEPAAIERHLAWASRAQAAWMALPASAVSAAAFGLVPTAALIALAATQVALLVLAGRAGCALARRRAGLPAPGSAASIARPRMPAARFRGVPAWAAIVFKDALVIGRRTELRQGATGVAIFGAVSLLGWFLPTGPPAPGEAAPAAATAFDLRHLATFFVTLLGAAALAEWMVMLVGSDPFAALRVLPCDVRSVWRARFTWIAVIAAMLVAGHALLARGLALPARLLFVGWVAAATAGIAVLGLHLALTLYPRTGPARPLLVLTFGVMAIASIAVFLSGWLVLVVAIVLTALRLPRWNRASEEAA
jgi:hypothetical protein